MKLKILLNLGQEFPPYKENEIVDADEPLAMRLIKRGLAEEVKGHTASLPAATATIEADEPTPREMVKPAPDKKPIK